MAADRRGAQCICGLTASVKGGGVNGSGLDGPFNAGPIDTTAIAWIN